MMQIKVVFISSSALFTAATQETQAESESASHSDTFYVVYFHKI